MVQATVRPGRSCSQVHRPPELLLWRGSRGDGAAPARRRRRSHRGGACARHILTAGLHDLPRGFASLPRAGFALGYQHLTRALGRGRLCVLSGGRCDEDARGDRRCTQEVGVDTLRLMVHNIPELRAKAISGTCSAGHPCTRRPTLVLARCLISHPLLICSLLYLRGGGGHGP